MDRKPFLPSDLPKPDPLKLWRQCAMAMAVAKIRGMRVDAVAKHYWADEPKVAEAVIKAATTPASTGGWGGQLAGSVVGPFLRSLAPTSAAARLFAECDRVSLVGHNVATLPRPAGNFPASVFVGEGQPIPVMQGAFQSSTLGPQRKLAGMTGLTQELADYSAEPATEVIDLAMRGAAGGALDAAVFSNAAADAIRPAGLLNGVTAIPAATGPGPADMMVEDLSGLAGAIGDAGGGSGILYFANPRQATAIELRAEAFAERVVPTPRLPDGTVVAIETGGVASAFDGLPQIDIASATAVHFEDTTPAQLAAPGSPNVVAAPVHSTFQTAELVLRLILRCAWTVRMPGAVQVVTGTSW